MGHAMQTPGHDPHDTDVRDLEKARNHHEHSEYNRTPPSEAEKENDLALAPTVSRGPTVHEKVSRASEAKVGFD